MPISSAKLSIIIFVGIALGFLLPSVGMEFQSLPTYLLMVLIFFTSLKMSPGDFRKIRPSTILLGCLFILGLMPLLSVGGLVFGSAVFAGVLLAFSCPSASASTFFVEALGGDPSLAIVLTMVTGMVSIVALPLTMLVGVGTAIKFNAVSILFNMIEILLIPMVLGLLSSRYLAGFSKAVLRYDRLASYVIIIFILWGGIAGGVGYIQSDLYGFLKINLLITALLTVGMAVVYLIGRRLGKEAAIALAVTSFLKNAILGLVIGNLTFGPAVLPTLVANLVDQNLMLIVIGAFTKRKG